MVSSGHVKELRAAVLFLSRAGGNGAFDTAELARVPIVYELARLWLGDSEPSDDVDLPIRFLQAVIEAFGAASPPTGGGPRSVSGGNEVVIVGRMLRLNADVPKAITHRRRAAVAGLNVSVAIFRKDVEHNKFDGYVMRFAELAVAFANRTRTRSISSDDDTPVQESPARSRIARLSARLTDEIGAQYSHVHIAADAPDLYVVRNIEAQLVADLQRASPDTRVLIGEAGYGKTSVLWSLCRTFEQQGRSPLLLSATWLQREADGSRVTTANEVIEAVEASPDDTVVLLDTADLMLHSEATRIEVIDLVERIARLGVPSVVSTRPLEARSLPASFGRRVTLELYDITNELPFAIRALSATFCPEAHPPGTDPVAAILSARARGLIVNEVCRSPLLLRMLFELSSPGFPQLEIDVTGLFALFWERRINADIRHADDPGYAVANEDCSESTGLLGISMLALGSLEPRVADVVRRATEVARIADLRPEQTEVARVLRVLVGRGVMVVSDTVVRFFHQTFFEYAAAKGLCARAAEHELPRLIDRLEQLPDDLFVGAVVEQVLIMLVDDDIARPAVRGALVRLIESGQPNLVAISMVVWAHHPDSVAPAELGSVSPLTVASLQRFIRSVSGVHSDAAAVLRQLEWIWTQQPILRISVIGAVQSLIERAPAAVVDFVRRTDVFACLVVDHTDFVRANAEPRVLLQRVIEVDPAFGRAQLLMVLFELTLGEQERLRAAHTHQTDKQKAKQRQGKEAVAQYLRVAAAQWPQFGTDELLGDLEHLVGRIQAASGDSDSRVVREALGEVVAARWLKLKTQPTWNADWRSWVDALCRDIEAEVFTDDGSAQSGDESPVFGSRLVAVGYVLMALVLPRDRPVLDATLAALLSLGGPSAPRQLARGCLVQPLIHRCSATEVVIDALGARIDGHLPAEHQTFTPGGELWAAVARSILTDNRIPATVVLEALTPAARTYAADVRLWTTRTRLVALAAAAISAGDQSALQAVWSMAGSEDSAARARAINIFLDNARDRASERPEVLVPLSLTLACRVGRTGTVKDLLLHHANTDALRDDADMLVEWVGSLLAGTDKQQADGADFLRLLAESAIIRPDFDTVVNWYEGLRDPAAKANLLTAVATLTIRTDDLSDAERLFTSIITTSRTPNPTIIGIETQDRLSPRVLDAARDALLEARAFLPGASPAHWDEVFALTFAPRLTGDTRIQVGGAGNLSRFITLEVDNGYLDAAVEQLSDVVGVFDSLSKTQIHDVVNRMRVAVGTIARHAEPRHHETLADIAEQAPTQLRKQLSHALLSSRISPQLERRLAGYLPERPRIAGLGAFPQVLSMPDRTLSEIDQIKAEIVRCQHHLQRATQRAYITIKESGVTSSAMAHRLGINEPSYRKLNGKKSWRVPSIDVCKALDDYGTASGHTFGLVEALRALEAAETRNHDIQSWTRRPQ